VTKRLDIQGMRAVAVLLVILDHTVGWPRGGFIGVDVFFVISGFLITGILLRDAEESGHVSILNFYRRRVRRIVPAATLTLAAIAVAAWLMFSPRRAADTWWDTVSAFFFISNWRFAIQGTDYFTADGPLSPVRHFWSLSVEEQFYFVWPAVMAIVVFVAARFGLRGRHRIAGTIMALLVGVSFWWALVDTAARPTWAYFSTLTRAWELGFGAFIAIVAATMSKIPDALRPVLAWLGLAAIVFGAWWITEDMGFPGPWAAVPVLGTGLVIIAGTGGTTRFLRPITNPVAVIIGDLSYSLYLWHWPVTIFLGTYLDQGWQFYVCALALTAGLSTLAYYFVEQPILESSWLKPKDEQTWRERAHHSSSPWRRMRYNLTARFTFQLTGVRQVAALSGVVFLVAGLAALAMVEKRAPTYISKADIAALDPVDDTASQHPAIAALQEQIEDAVVADAWPALNPPMDAVLSGDKIPADIARCGRGVEIGENIDCWFGANDAPHTIVLAGDSIGMSYLSSLIAFVDASNGQWKLLNQASIGCPFIDVEIADEGDAAITANCPAAKQHAIDVINQLRPNVVLISNRYGQPINASTGQPITEDEYAAGLQQIIAKLTPGVSAIGLMTAPPPDKDPSDCYRPDRSPADCVGGESAQYLQRAQTETAVANSVQGELIDTRPLFCTSTQYCPMFAGVTPMKVDTGHISPAYAAFMSPAFIELIKGTKTFATIG
jgi:peptidoglycan/LPS O-acetylase OafA/YrhL